MAGLAEQLAEKDLGPARPHRGGAEVIVVTGVVEEGHARLEGAPHHGEGVVPVDDFEGEPRPKAQGAHLQARGSQRSLFHGRRIGFLNAFFLKSEGTS
jgi:hypothetical protein